MQLLEWRITAPTNQTKSFSENICFYSIEDLISQYLTEDKVFNKEKTEQTPFSFPNVRLTWTGSKVDLVELIYAWEAAGCFNHGHVTIKEIVSYIQIIFNIDLGDYYHTFRDLRRRVDRTAFLDSLISHLSDRMDKADLK